MSNDENGRGAGRRNGIDQDPAFQEYVQILLRGKWIVISVFALVMGGTAYLTFTTKPVYESSATVLVDTKGQQSSMPLFDVNGMGTIKNIKNEIEILKSRVLAEAVAQKLLALRFIDSDKKERILLIQAGDERSASDSLASVTQIVRRLGSAVSFDPVRDSDILKITASSTNPREAALLANTYAQAYYNRNLLASRTRSRAVSEFLDQQMQSRQQTLSASEDTLQKYMQTKGIVSLDDESRKVIDQLSALEATRDADDINIQSLTKTLTSYEDELKKIEPNVSKVMGEANDPYIRLLQEQLAKLEVQKDVTIAQNPAAAGQALYRDKLKEIDDQIAALRKNLQARTDEFLKTLMPGQGAGQGATSPSGYLSQLKQKVVELRIERGALEAKRNAMSEVIKEYENQFNQIPAKSIEFARLQRNRLSNEKLYLLVEEKYNEASIKEKSEFGYIDIIDPAIVPGSPVSPKVNFNLLLGAILGLGLGIGFVFLREQIDVRVRTPEDLKKRGFTTLTAVSLMDDEIRKMGGGTRIDRDGMLVDAHLLSYVNPLSPTAESYRRLRTNIQYSQLDQPVGSILVTSPNPSEGKSTTVSNLAITLAQAGKKVVLLDTDLRKPGLHNEFGVERLPGLTDFLSEDRPMATVVRKTVVENLDLICCGSIPPNPSEILGSQKMKEFVLKLRTQYDMVLFDSPPVLAVTDPAILATLADSVIVVVSSGHTRADSLEHSMTIMDNVHAKTLGLVLNNFDLRIAYGGYYKYYRNKYYSYGYGWQYGGGNGEGRKRVKNEK